MSPEQINGARDLDHRTDIYALGVIAYEMFAGVLPFVGDSVQAIMAGHLFKPPPRLMDLTGEAGGAGRHRRDRRSHAGRRMPPTATRLPATAVRSAGPRSPPAALSRRARPCGAVTTRVQASGASRPRIPRENHGAARGRPPARSSWRRWPSRASRSGGRGRNTDAGERRPPPPPPPPPRPPAPDYDALRARAAGCPARIAARRRARRPRAGLGRARQDQDHPSVPALTDLTEHDPDGEVRGHTAAALGALGRCLDGDDARQAGRRRAAAAQGLVRVGAGAARRQGRRDAAPRVRARSGSRGVVQRGAHAGGSQRCRATRRRRPR